jgi:hypothetical protein
MPYQTCYVFLYWRDSWNDGPPLHQIHYSNLLQFFLHLGLTCGCSEHPPLPHFTSAQCWLFLPPKMRTPSVCNKGSQLSYEICYMNSVNFTSTATFEREKEGKDQATHFIVSTYTVLHSSYRAGTFQTRQNEICLPHWCAFRSSRTK